MIRLLLDLGADPEIRGADGQNAFELAMARGSRESVIILRGEVGAALLEQSDEQRKVAQLKLEILAALKQGKSWNSSHKEGSTRFWFDGKAYQHSYQEHQSDFVETNSIPDDASALQWLYDQNKYGFGSETMLKIYQGILERL